MNNLPQHDEPQADDEDGKALSLGEQFAQKPRISDGQVIDAFIVLAEAYPETGEESEFDKLLSGDISASTGYPDGGIEYNEDDYPDSEDDVSDEDKAFWGGVQHFMGGNEDI